MASVRVFLAALAFTALSFVVGVMGDLTVIAQAAAPPSVHAAIPPPPAFAAAPLFHAERLSHLRIASLDEAPGALPSPFLRLKDEPVIAAKRAPKHVQDA